ncbi:MAG: outer membrane protein assembly factor BamE [Firmicutes bacterium]|nr:outer membrane protein assembly factor BamE [Bacillota bacterium]
METNVQKRRLVVAMLLVAAGRLAVWLLMTAVTAVGCLLIRSPTVDLLLRIHVGMTRAEVLAALGEPKAIYPPERFDDAYNGWYPKPRVRADRPVWVYEVFHSIRIIVY